MGIYGEHCTQAGQVLPLALGMVPGEIRPLAQRALLANIAERKNHLSTGFVGTPYLLAILAERAPEVGHAITTQRDYPSWYSMTKGAGCDQMMETWAGGQAFMPSLGGNIATWNMEALAGIRPDSDGPGFKKILIQPAIVGNLTWVKAHFDSPHGRIVSHWRRDGERLTINVTIPCNTAATVRLPGFENTTLDGRPLDKSQFELMAGRWEIVATSKKRSQ
jgi:alpha-L-rhamnosidase